MVTTATLTDFLLARITEDEVNARSIQNAEYFHGIDSDVEAEVLAFAEPDRILRECEAKRQVAEIHGGNSDVECRCQDDWVWTPCPTIRVVAAVYADHPDYRPEWRP